MDGDGGLDGIHVGKGFNAQKYARKPPFPWFGGKIGRRRIACAISPRRCRCSTRPGRWATRNELQRAGE
ncbi:MAG: hypothetical protein N2483_03950 [Burkholderiaceae bacterium]|nr:hypothetical protein [Burkholderiaceae bacterium]